MESFKKHLAAALRERESALVHRLSTQTHASGGVQIPTEEVEQMVRGFYRMLGECLAGPDSELRAFYLDTIMPGLRDAGTPLNSMIPGSARVLTMVAADAVAQLGADDREEATAWLGEFVEAYLRDIMAVWERKASPG